MILPAKFLSLIVLGFWLMGCSSPISATSSSDSPTVSNTATIYSKESQTNLGQMLPVSARANMGSSLIELEVTRTPDEQALGLMYRTSLPDNRGMLFEFEPARPVSFWMKNVKIPLDMVFLREGTIRAIAASVPPCETERCPSYGPNTPIDQVIELRGGRAAELKLKVGQKVKIEFLSTGTTAPSER